MWVRGSYTVENSVIVPMFTMIVVSCILLCCNLHDRIIRRNIQRQAAIEIELCDLDENEQNQLIDEAQKYSDKRTIFSNSQGINVKDSFIKRSEPEKTIRIIQAIKEVIE